MDGKAENVRSVLFLNARDPFLDLNKTDDFGKTLIHRVLSNCESNFANFHLQLCEIRCKVTNTQCELIALLASHGARLDVCENNLGQIPLHVDYLCYWHLNPASPFRSQLPTADFALFESCFRCTLQSTWTIVWGIRQLCWPWNAAVTTIT
jgi:hypothetical protein